MKYTSSFNVWIVRVLLIQIGGLLLVQGFVARTQKRVHWNTSMASRRSTDFVVCGGGPAGLLSAIMLAQKFPKKTVEVYERLSEPPVDPTDDTYWMADVSKFYLIGLGGRGISALETFEVWKDVVSSVAVAVPGRKDWTPQQPEGVERQLTDRTYTTQVLPRDKLVSCLHSYIVNHHAGSIKLHYGKEVVPIDLNTNESVLIKIVPSEPMQSSNDEDENHVQAEMLVAADGSARTVCNYMEQYDRSHGVTNPFKVSRYEDNNERVYKSLPLRLPQEWKHDLNYGVRSDGNRVIWDALPANDKGDYCAVVLMQQEDKMARANVDPAVFETFLNEYVPQFASLLDDDVVRQVAKKPPSSLPKFRFVGPRLHHGRRTVLVGDCAHTVKPYFGLGANSALEDVKILSNCIDESNGNLTKAILDFSACRSDDIATLVHISHSLDQPGLLGAFTFVIPIILDAVFSKLLPHWFTPNVIQGLQNEELTFCQVALMKRRERLAQVAILATFLVGLTSVGFELVDQAGRIIA